MEVKNLTRHMALEYGEDTEDTLVIEVGATFLRFPVNKYQKKVLLKLK